MDKICRICLEEMELTRFPKRKSSRDGHAHICKNCYNERYNKLDRGELTVGDYNEFFNRSKISELSNKEARKYEKLISNEILKKLGYDLDSELSIHQQFMMKHNLVD